MRVLKQIIIIMAISVSWSGFAAAEGADDPNRSVTAHSGNFHGVDINYTAVVGETILKAEDGTPRASIFSTSYIMDGDVDPTTRPVTFLWNGGPGSASLWLHMGVFGPKRVDIPSDARDDGAAPFPIIHNADGLLDVTDIVFIDPVGTGFSHPLGETEASEFYGVTQDAQSVAQFIRLWLTEHGRWNSPKYIGGESYGTTRSAAVINQLEGGFNDVSINGIILVSTILDFTIDIPLPGNDMPYIMFLPTMAATGAYHGKVDMTDRTIEQLVAEAREFALGDYASALLKGNDLAGDERATVRARLSSLIGISEDYLEDADLRMQPGRFQRELLRDQGLSVGRLDGRYKGVDYDNAGETPDIDPSFYGIDGAYTAAINQYLRVDLGYDTERSYSVISGLGGSWDWDTGGFSRGYLNVAPYIATALRQNSQLRVFNAAGYYDFATPLLGAEYSMNRTGWPDDRVTYEYYEAGHMMYIHHPSLDKLLSDVRAFIVAGSN